MNVQRKGINVATRKVPFDRLGLTVIVQSRTDVIPIAAHLDYPLIWRTGT